MPWVVSFSLVSNRDKRDLVCVQLTSPGLFQDPFGHGGQLRIQCGTLTSNYCSVVTGNKGGLELLDHGTRNIGGWGE